MLLEMRIKNFILIESLNLSFHKGLNIFTGETGAGKSMIIGAINVGLGEKVSPDVVRKGADKATVQLVFSIEEPEVLALLESHDIHVDDKILIITRDIFTSNRSVVRINDRVSTLQTLKELSDLLIDVHGQHEHQTLLYPRNHLRYLDLLGDDAHLKLKGKVAASYQEIKRIQGELEHVISSGSYDTEYLKFQLNEIESLNLTEDDEENLEAKYKYYKNIEEIFQNTQSIISIFSDTDGVKDLIQKSMNLVQNMMDFEEKMKKYDEQLNEVYYLVDDLSTEFRHYLEQLDVDEEEVYQVESRMNAINELKIKYGKSIQDILETKRSIEEKLEQSLHRTSIIESLEAQMKEAKKTYILDAKSLSEKRRDLKSSFETQVIQELELLNMGVCQFEIRFIERILDEGEYRLSPNGFDDIEFLISTNPGMPLKPLAKIASGGEISRIMLAIKIALSNNDVIKSLVFDEVDTGISGQTAVAVSKKIHEITKNYQVICITHLPQIAVMADSHLLIYKSVQSDISLTDVVELDHHEKLTEVARLLSGTDSETAQENAREMLEQAQTHKNIS